MPRRKCGSDAEWILLRHNFETLMILLVQHKPSYERGDFKKDNLSRLLYCYMYKSDRSIA